MNHIFRDLINKIIVIYLDDILIFSKDIETHENHLEYVLSRCKAYNIQLNLEKCKFFKTRLPYLGFVINKGYIDIDEFQKSKIDKIKIPRNISELRSILGVFTFFKRFIKNFAIKIKPLQDRLKKGNFEIGETEINTIDLIKKEFRNNRMLRIPNFKKKFILYSDASDYAIGGALFQEYEDGEYPITWLSRLLLPRERNYTTTEKELLSVVWLTKKLRIYLQNKFTLCTDHKSIKYLMGKSVTTQRLTRWQMSLQDFQFDVKYIKGDDNKIADWASRYSKELNIMNILTENEIIKAHEDIGHGGIEATATILRLKGYEIGKSKEKVKEIIEKCEKCIKFKVPNKSFIKQRINLENPFSTIGIDIVGPLPKTENGNKYLITAIDYLTRWGEVRAIKSKTAENVANFIFEEIICRHGPPNKIITDQGREFINETITKLCKRMNSTKSRTSAYHPQTNGACERFNRTLVEKLAKLSNENIDDWDIILPVALYCYRISPSSRTGKSPFQALYGRNPNLLSTKQNTEEVEESENEIFRRMDLLRNNIQERARENRRAEQDNTKGAKVDDFEINDIVYRRALSMERKNKLDPKFIGPFKITRKNANGSYTIKSIYGKEYLFNRKDLVRLGNEVSEEEISHKGGDVLQEGIVRLTIRR